MKRALTSPRTPPSLHSWRRSSPSNGPKPRPGTPPLARLLSRSSFLLNEVAVRKPCSGVKPDDVVDVLPPFAGG